MSDWYIATDGDSGNTGAIDSPWDIASGLLKYSTVQPGDTVYLRAGTYVHPTRTQSCPGFLWRFNGSLASRITIRPYPEERVILDGGLKTSGTPTYTDIRDLEVIVSEVMAGNRQSIYDSLTPNDLIEPLGGVEFYYGDNLRLINCLIHDNLFSGIGFWASCSNCECYGNIVYANGYTGPTGVYGTGMYAQNSSGTWRYLKNNILAKNYGYGWHVYTQGSFVDYFHFENNILTPRFDGYISRSLIGGTNASSNNYFTYLNNAHWHNTLRFGYQGVGGTYLNLQHNQIVNSKLELETFTPSTISDNFQWDPEWIAGVYTGNLLPSGPSGGAPIPSVPVVKLFTNDFDATRAYVAVYTYQSESSADVDVSGWLNTGDSYKLLDPTDIYGTPVDTGLVTAGVISVPTSGYFSTYVIVKTASGGGGGGGTSYQISFNELGIDCEFASGNQSLEEIGLAVGAAGVTLATEAGEATAEGIDAAFINVPYLVWQLFEFAIPSDPRFYQQTLGETTIDFQESETILPTIFQAMAGDASVVGVSGTEQQAASWFDIRVIRI